MLSAVKRVLSKLIVTQEHIDFNSFLHQIDINQFLLSFTFDGSEHCRRNIGYQGPKNDALEQFIALISKRCEGVDFYVESVKVLEEPLHPSDHDTVVGPLLLQPL
jgi:hypothetical protein